MKFQYLAVSLTLPTVMATAFPLTAHAQVAQQSLLRYGSHGSQVVVLQKDLNALGYSVGQTDGAFGPRTLSEVKLFQRSRHLQVDGVVGSLTWKTLNSAMASKSKSTIGSVSRPVAQQSLLRYGSHGSQVVVLQKDLNALGYSVGQTDGAFGPRTLSEVKLFQKSRHLQVDGVVGSLTWKTLNSAMASKSKSTNGSFSQVDLRFTAPGNINTQSINQYLSHEGSPMSGLGQSFMNAQQEYGADANYLVSHAILESNWGKSSIALAKNNLFGYGAYDANPGNDAGMFPSSDYAIRFQAWEVRNNYLEPGSSQYVSPTLNGMNTHYATDPHWSTSIGALMNQMANYVGSDVSAYQQYTSGVIATPPQSRVEPVFYINGATVAAQSTPYYGGVPYYPTMASGIDGMYFGPIGIGSAGQHVVEIQRFLNSRIHAGLTVDGQFGKGTAGAVKNFEAAQGLKQDGVWSFSMWKAYIYTAPGPTVSARTTVQVDEIEQGMAGSYVVPWFHIPGKGWVDSQYAKFTNVYRLTVPNPTSSSTSIPVYRSSNRTGQLGTLHSGDFVVAGSVDETNGMYQIKCTIENPYPSSSPETLVTGYVSAQNTRLLAQH